MPLQCPARSSLLSRIRALFGSRRLDDEFDREVASHLAMLTEEHIRRGLSPDEARRARPCCVSEDRCRSRNSSTTSRGLPFVETTLQDLRYGLRALRKNPAYSAGRDRHAGHRHRRRHRGLQRRRRGAAAAAALPDPGRLVRVFETNPLRNWTRNIAVAGQLRRLEGAEQGLHRHRRLRAVQHQRQRRERHLPHRLRRAAGAEVARRDAATSSASSARAPLLGRTFTDDETVRGQGARRDPELRPLAERRSAAIRRSSATPITLSGRAYDVVGVMPRDFFFPGRDVQLWVPVGYAPIGVRRDRAGRTGSASSRGCKPGVSLEQARAGDGRDRARSSSSSIPTRTRRWACGSSRFHDSLAYRAAAGAADAERRRRPAVPDRLREHRQPAAGSRRQRGRASWRSAARSAPGAGGCCGSC